MRHKSDEHCHVLMQAAVELDRQGPWRGGVGHRRERMARLDGNELAWLSQTSTKRIWMMKTIVCTF